MAKAGTDVECTKADQMKINEFSRYNQQMNDVEEKIAKRNKILEDINDANGVVEELGITDDEAPGKIKHMISSNIKT